MSGSEGDTLHAGGAQVPKDRKCSSANESREDEAPVCGAEGGYTCRFDQSTYLHLFVQPLNGYHTGFGKERQRETDNYWSLQE